MSERSLTIRNRQRAQRVDLKLLRDITNAVLCEELRVDSYDVTVQLVASPEMARLNETFLGHQGSTDVITFDYADRQQALHGDIIVCVDEAITQAKRFHATWQAELVRYVTHGALHLLGFDDRTAQARRRMKSRENALVRALARRFVLTKLESTDRRRIRPQRAPARRSRR